MEHERGQIAELFSAGHKAGAWGDLPATPVGFDPQILVSRNEGVQPFFLTYERDSLVVTMSGEGFVEFRDSNVLHFRVAPGDFVYVPAGTPHRIRAEGPMVQLRFKALDAGSEVVSWHCPECSTELWHREFDATSEIAQRVYLEATSEFNSNEALRRCAKCSATHPAVDVGGTKWDEIAAYLDAERANAPARATKGDRLPPAKDREPLRTNVFELMRGTSTQLLPLFPYLGPGAMLPAGALFRGRPDANFGRFFHRNSEEEVNVCFGAQQALGAAGVMFIGGKMHEVQAPLLDTNDPNAFMVAVITQRQQDEGRAQKESVIFRCSECNKKLHQVDYSAELPDPDRPDVVTGGRVDDEYAMFPTMWGSILATDSFNSDEKARTCTECGHVNAPFPEEAWGWQNYVDRHEVVNSARHLLDESARKAEAAASAV
jgi:mannose-6-phosphate isomerase-like protein (cupin superfamily)